MIWKTSVDHLRKYGIPNCFLAEEGWLKRGLKRRV